MSWDYDFIVIGSGFGGSVSALRLTEKGYRVAVFEMGKRYGTKDFPKSNWNLRKYLWAPGFGLRGIFQMSLFSHAWVLTGTGVGGGSLVYSNTLWVPPDKVWQDARWARLKNWKDVMPQHYHTAQRMLGAAHNEYLGTADTILLEMARKEGYDHTFYTTNVSIYFGEPDVTVPDPYFGGEGPERTGCTLCGGCMVGCRVGAKNTLDKNYLYLAEKRGAKIFAETKVIHITPLNGKSDGSDGYQVETVNPLNPFSGKKTFTTRGLVFAAGVLGTVKLLLEMKGTGALPNLSDRVGDYVRTNSESIIGVRINNAELDISEGVCIGSGIFVDEDTHIEAVRFPNGSDSIAPLTTLLSTPQPGIPRPLTWLATIIKHPLRFLRSLVPFGFAKNTLILLVMQTADSFMQMRLKRSWLPPFKKQLATQGPRVPTYIEKANDFAMKVAEQYGGMPLTAWTEIFLDIPTTAHILGGASMGSSAEDGVIDRENRVFNYKNLYVCDGSMIGANLGVNPSLTITALTEHAMSYVPPASQATWQETGKTPA